MTGAARQRADDSSLDGDRRRVAPEALERVVRTGVLEEYVHEHVAIVQEHPPAVRPALRVQWAYAVRLQLLANGVADRSHVRRRLAAADEEIVRHRRYALHVENGEIHRLLVQGRAPRAFRRAPGTRARHQAAHPYRRCRAM